MSTNEFANAQDEKQDDHDRDEDRKTAPEGSSDPPPRPVNDSDELQDDERNGEKAGEPDASALVRLLRVAHDFTPRHSAHPPHAMMIQ
jgi:hypothetical protein